MKNPWFFLALLWAGGAPGLAAQTTVPGKYLYGTKDLPMALRITGVVPNHKAGPGVRPEGVDTCFGLLWQEIMVRNQVKWAYTLTLDRWNPELGRMEHLETFEWTARTGSEPGISIQNGNFGEAEAPDFTQRELPGILSAGDWYRLRFASEGLYKLTPEWLQTVGLSPSRVRTDELVLYGGGRGMLPEANSAYRPDGLQQYPLQFHGDGDGVFEAGEYYLFYVPGSELLTLDPATSRLARTPHPYDDDSYLYLCPSGHGLPVTRMDTLPPLVLPGPGPLPVSYRADHLISYEKEWVNPIKSGRQWLGESFDQTVSRSFSLSLPHYTAGDSCTLSVRMAVRSQGSPSPLSMRLQNGPPRTLTLPVVGTYYLDPYCSVGEDTWTTDPGSDALNLNIVLNKQNSSAMAWLDRLSVQSRPVLNPALWPSAAVWHNASTLGPTPTLYRWPAWTASPLQVWDVTVPYQATACRMDTLTESGQFWQQIECQGDTLRHLVFVRGSTYADPAGLAPLSPQDLAGAPCPDMVIVAPEAFQAQANELADLHLQRDGLGSLVVDPLRVYHEFSSGRRDPTAIRDFLRNLYRKGKAGPGSDSRLKYLLLLGATSYDPKDRISGNHYLIPIYQSVNSLDPLASYCSDAYYGLMDDHEGAFREGGADRMDLGIGRIPARTQAQAAAAVAKIRDYFDTAHRGAWRNEFVFLADDEDYNVHLNDCQTLVDATESLYPQGVVRKLFMDAYPQESRPGGARYPEVNARINQAMEQGALVFAYMGHGGVNGLAEERVMTLPEIDNWQHRGRYPLMVTATCEFSRFDNPSVFSAGERAFFNPYGGAIALLTTTRVTFTNFNLSLSSRLFREHLFRKEQGHYLRLGDLYREAANPELGAVNTRNFSLLGDPALRLAFPQQAVRIDTLTDTLRALSELRLSGSVLDAQGALDTAFRGLLQVQVYDKAANLRTLANDQDSYVKSFQEYKDLIFKGIATVQGGRWESTFRVPRDISYAFGPGRVNVYALQQENDTSAGSGNSYREGGDAAGDSRDLVVGGSATDYLCASTGPRIQMSMNDSLFRSGGLVGSLNHLWIRLEDEDGINTTGSGIGRQMLLALNGDWSRAVALNSFYTADADAYKKGVVRYPLGSLPSGRNLLQFKAWDVCNNSSTGQLEFLVEDDLQLKVRDLRILPHPLTGGVRPVWEFNHNRPGQNLRVQLSVFDPEGRRVHQQDLYWQGEGNFARFEALEDLNLLQNGWYVAHVTVSDSDQVALRSGRILVQR